MRHAALLLALVLSPTPLLASMPRIPAMQAADSSLSENFSVATRTLVPGRDLTPGDYKITIIEHLSDRVILQISNKNGKVQSTFLGIIANASPSVGPIRWAGKGTPALRGFSFPGASSVEFVYPKAQAVTIAKSNTDQVLAIDPTSDNLPSSQESLSTQDMQIVTLWSLRASRVGPDAAPAIEAARYHVPAQPAAAPVYVARATPPPAMPPAPAAPRAAAPAPKVAASPKPTVAAPKPVAARPQTASVADSSEQGQPSTAVTRKHTIAALPHTASDLPLMLLTAVLALMAAAALRIRRIYGL